MNGKSCIFFLADGARADLFEYLLGKGDLPNIGKYIVDEGSFHSAVSVFPSTTGPAYTPYLIGKFPGRCNLPGIRWFDRKLFKKSLFSFKGFRSYVGPETFFINGDLDTEGGSTLFEVIPRSVSILNEITRGIGHGGDKTRFLKVYYKIKSHFTKGTDEVDNAAGRLLLESLKGDPSFVFSVFLGIDTYSHQFHPFHKKVIESYKLIDSYVGFIGDYLKTERKLDETLLVIGSDHGLSSTHSHFDSLEFMNQSGYKTFYYPNIFKHLFDADAVNMISGNSMSHLYFKNGSGWDRKTYIEELDSIVNDLIERPEVDIVAGINLDGKIVIKSSRGEAITWIENENKFRYEVVSSDPFGFKEVSSSFNHREALEKTLDTNYPDAIVQIIQLFDSPRTGDLVVSAKPGFDLRAKHENPEHCSSHGSLIREHMIAPIAMNLKSKTKFVRTVDIYPTILKFLDVEIPNSIDGNSLIA